MKMFASEFFMSEEYLSKLFKNCFGINFITYLNQTRMERAKELVCSTNIKMADISHLVGYSDPKYFVKIYKQFYGKTPSDMRDGND